MFRTMTKTFFVAFLLSVTSCSAIDPFSIASLLLGTTVVEEHLLRHVKKLTISSDQSENIEGIDRIFWQKQEDGNWRITDTNNIITDPIIDVAGSVLENKIADTLNGVEKECQTGVEAILSAGARTSVVSKMVENIAFAIDQDVLGSYWQ